MDLDVVTSALDHNKPIQQKCGSVYTNFVKFHRGKNINYHRHRQAQKNNIGGEYYIHEDPDEVEIYHSRNVQVGVVSHRLLAQHQYQKFQHNKIRQVGGLGHS